MFLYKRDSVKFLEIHNFFFLVGAVVGKDRVLKGSIFIRLCFFTLVNFSSTEGYENFFIHSTFIERLLYARLQ